METETPSRSCFRCGRTNHTSEGCWAKDVVCHNCSKRGHLAAVCRSSKQHKGQGRVNYGSGKGRKGSTKWVSLEHESGCEEEEKKLPMFQVGGVSSKPIKVFVRVNGVRLPMELDTGATVSIISRDMKEKYFLSTPLQMSRVVLRTYTNERMGVVGELNVEVGDKGQEKS